MSSKSIVIGVVVVVVVLGGCFLYTKSDLSDQKMVPPTEEGAQTGTSAEGKKMAFDSFLKQGGSHVCTVHQDVGGTESTGTVYVDGDKVKGEFNTTAQGMTMKISFMNLDGYSYSWSSMSPTMGFKTKINQSAAGAGAGASASGSYSWNAEQIGDYDCQSWSPDASAFALPSGVVFAQVGQ
jgi:hypothetical protein